MTALKHQVPVRVAHLSDVHLGPIRGFTPGYWNLKRATGYINWHRNRRHAYRRDVLDRIVADVAAQHVDHILVSGDLCNIGLPEEMDAATHWLHSVGPPERVSVVPGNHDIYTHIGRDQGVARWAAYMTGEATFAYGGDAAGGLTFPYVRRIGPIALIALNSAVRTPPLIAHGELGRDQLSRLAAILDETSSLGLRRLVMLHHPPLPGQTRTSHALKDAAALRDVLSAHGADVVVHGHLHRSTRASVALGRGRGAIPVLGVASASLGVPHAKEPLARYNILSFEGAKLTVDMRGLHVPDGPVAGLEQMVFELAPAGAI